MNEIKKYKAKLIKCPKCYQLLEIEGVSIKSINCAMEDLYLKIKSHLLYGCFVTCTNKKKVHVSISTTTEKDLKIKTEWQDNNFFLI